MKILYALYKIYFFVVFIITSLIFYPFFSLLLLNERHFDKVFKLKKLWAFIVCFFTGIFVDVKGEEHILKNENYVICANHMSYFDIVLMYRVIPFYFVFMGKAELEKWPFVGIFFKKQMDISVNRSSVRQSALAFQKANLQLLKGNSIAIFPEGTISEKTPEMLRFKNGAFQMAINQNVEVLPITFLNNHLRLNNPEKMFSKNLPGITRVIIHKPISVKGGKLKEDLVFLRENTFKTIQTELFRYYEYR